jgi:hypothetical protein
MLVKKAVDRRPGHLLNGDVLRVEPDCEVLDGLNVLLNGAPRMAAFVEIIDVGFDPGTEGWPSSVREREGGGRIGPA